ncbi:MAG: CDP-alcohol phosphatidyltransferase family protein [Candidatus Methanomethylophilaceae archaeon]|nr:CDP-alcohol phosphatidyltransferase family protein [Candidatus Methanomethylophilaceae archaeon]
MWKHTPNLLSALRLLSVPFFVYFLIADGTVVGARIALVIYFAASITDIFDGRIARKYHIESNVGVVLDAGADKLFVVAGLVCPMILGILPVWFVVILLIREAYIFWIAMEALRKKVLPRPIFLGKAKTVFEMATVVALLIFMAITDGLEWSGLWLLEYGEVNFLTILVSGIAWMGFILSLASVVPYTQIYIEENRKWKERQRQAQNQ